MNRTTTHKLIIVLGAMLLLAAGVFWWKATHERPRLSMQEDGENTRGQVGRLVWSGK